MAEEDVLAGIDNLSRRLAAFSKSQAALTRATLGLSSNINDTVPTVASQAYVAADAFYCPLGAVDSSANLPYWLATASNVSLQQWDATDLRFYARISSAAAPGSLNGGGIRPFFYSGFLGTATTWAPKATDATKLTMKWRSRFNLPVGASSACYIGLSATAAFTGTPHCIRVGRTWSLGVNRLELATGDGAAVNATMESVANSIFNTASTAFHNFRLEWISNSVSLYCDEVLLISRTTNLPAQPLAVAMPGPSNAGGDTVDVVDVWLGWSK